MAIPLKRQLDAESRKPIINAAPATANGEVVVYEQLNSAIEAIAWKDDVRVASTANVTVASPGATIDAISMTANDRVLLKNQSTQTENGIYIWNGAATPMTRAVDASTFDELEGAIVTATEGTSNASTTWRQTQVNGVIGTNNVVWTSFGTAAAAASETTAGIAELATQAETDAGTDDLRIVTPLKLATYSGRAKRFSQTIGDGSATSIAVTHNLNTQDCEVYVREATGSLRMVLCEVQHTSVNSVTLLFDAAPASNALRVTVLA
jgi:hypothetical protein